MLRGKCENMQAHIQALSRCARECWILRTILNIHLQSVLDGRIAMTQPTLPQSSFRGQSEESGVALRGKCEDTQAHMQALSHCARECWSIYTILNIHLQRVLIGRTDMTQLTPLHAQRIPQVSLAPLKRILDGFGSIRV